jgi:hypothetical protein
LEAVRLGGHSAGVARLESVAESVPTLHLRIHRQAEGDRGRQTDNGWSGLFDLTRGIHERACAVLKRDQPQARKTCGADAALCGAAREVVFDTGEEVVRAEKRSVVARSRDGSLVAQC